MTEITGTLDASEQPDEMNIESPDAIRERLRLLRDQLAERQARVRALTDKRGQARAAVAQSFGAWLNGQPRVTPDQLAQQFCKEQAALRAANGGDDSGPRIVPGPSMVDRQAAFSKGGSASDHVRGQHRNGGYRRGAYSSAARGAKLPSQR
jgi:Arc/MetJ-type ribon-helix-helix transcriptional regulator